VETIGRCLPPESGKFCTLFSSTAIRSIVHGPRAGLIDDLCLSGHVAEGVTFTKKIMASAAPRYMHSEP
jgi:hypothetical protein